MEQARSGTGDRTKKSDVSRYKISDIFVPSNKYEKCVIYRRHSRKFIGLTDVGKTYTLNDKQNRS